MLCTMIRLWVVLVLVSSAVSSGAACEAQADLEPSAQEPAPTAGQPDLLESLVGARQVSLLASATGGKIPVRSGPLSVAEVKFQGTWQGYDIDQTMKTWAFWIEGRTFRAEGGADEWYEGQVLIDSGKRPGWVDWVIEDCNCAYKGGVSTGVFEFDGDTIVMASPTPDDPRPEALDPTAGDVIRLIRTQGLDLLLNGDGHN
jgi:uncharacterized protein (TIGR03067 family)